MTAAFEQLPCSNATQKHTKQTRTKRPGRTRNQTTNKNTFDTGIENTGSAGPRSVGGNRSGFWDIYGIYMGRGRFGGSRIRRAPCQRNRSQDPQPRSKQTNQIKPMQYNTTVTVFSTPSGQRKESDQGEREREDERREDSRDKCIGTLD